MKCDMLEELVLLLLAIVVIVGIAAMVVIVVHDKSPCQTIEAPIKNNGDN